MATDPQSRKWQITINNPSEHELDHEKIKTLLEEFHSLVYYCMADEIGEEETPHTHIYFVSTVPIRFSTVKNKFQKAHIEKTLGTSMENRDYIAKSGKWANDEKHGTSIPGTFEEWGTLPVEGQGKRNDLALLRDLIQKGMPNAKIIDEYPQFLFRIKDIEAVRQTLREQEYSEVFRELEVFYIWGPTGTGKTRYVMERYGYKNVYRVTDYTHPFDTYNGQDVILFDEFRSDIKIGDMLKYLEGYPLMLPCRYTNRVACYTKVYIVSNIDFLGQYPNVRTDEPTTIKALERRIMYHLHFPSPSKRYTFNLVEKKYITIGVWDTDKNAPQLETIPDPTTPVPAELKDFGAVPVKIGQPQMSDEAFRQHIPEQSPQPPKKAVPLLPARKPLLMLPPPKEHEK